MLTFTTKNYPCSKQLAESMLPSLSYARTANSFQSTIQDYEGLFIGYGNRESCYPYREQNLYEEETLQAVRVAVLENDWLYAEFLMDFGGRLWKLYDKKAKRDILYTNDVIRLRNLSIRNAWFSGGVEWNCGLIGHTPFTCQRMYCAKVTGDGGEDVLRFYEFERVRSIYYQIDFWLDKNKLMARVRIDNQNNEVVPMYWWSNMAVPEWKGGRIAVPADSAYNNSDGMGIKKSSIPFDGGVDVSYPEHIPDTIDYFYDIPSDANKFIANVDAQGKGLLQISSNRLKGRKLFSWGHRKGSAHWQQTLTNKAGWYVEIQAGLGKTQYECLPMPPKTTWNFLECYTLADLGAQTVGKDYEAFVDDANAQVEAIASSHALDALCEETERTIALKQGELVCEGSGFGYLHNKVQGGCPAHLEFTPEQDIAMWQELAGAAPASDCPVSFAFGSAEKKLLAAASGTTDWRPAYLQALLAYDSRAFEKAKALAEQAFVLGNNVYLNHLYAAVLFQLEKSEASWFAEKALAQMPENYSVCESVFRLLLADEAYDTLIRCYNLCGEAVKQYPRLRMYLSYAYLKAGDAKQAEQILLADGGLQLLDFREGDRFLDRLYRGIRAALYGEDAKAVLVPEQFDFIVSKQLEGSV